MRGVRMRVYGRLYRLSAAEVDYVLGMLARGRRRAVLVHLRFVFGPKCGHRAAKRIMWTLAAMESAAEEQFGPRPGS